VVDGVSTLIDALWQRLPGAWHLRKNAYNIAWLNATLIEKYGKTTRTKEGNDGW